MERAEQRRAKVIQPRLRQLDQGIRMRLHVQNMNVGRREVDLVPDPSGQTVCQ
jgi:hypothetical protein